MAAGRTKRSGPRIPQTGKEARFHFELRLTREEIKRLEVAAAADLRAPASYVAKLLVEHLRRAPSAQRSPWQARVAIQRFGGLRT